MMHPMFLVSGALCRDSLRLQIHWTKSVSYKRCFQGRADFRSCVAVFVSWLCYRGIVRPQSE